MKETGITAFPIVVDVISGSFKSEYTIFSVTHSADVTCRLHALDLYGALTYFSLTPF
jgi:hypothetical protein